MHKRALLACLLVVAMLLSGCSLVKKDLEVDAATPILTVGEKVFTKGEIQSAVNSYLAQMQSYYSQYYGQNIDVTNAEIIADAQKNVIDQLTEQTVVEAKAKELGFDQLSEEDQKEVDDLWQSYYDMIKSYLYSDSELSEEELDKAITADVTNYFGMTKESLQASKVQELLRADTVKDVTVSDDEVKAEFGYSRSVHGPGEVPLELPFPGGKAVYAAVGGYPQRPVGRLCHLPDYIVVNGGTVSRGREKDVEILSVVAVETVPGAKPDQPAAVLKHHVHRAVAQPVRIGDVPDAVFLRQKGCY